MRKLNGGVSVPSRVLGPAACTAARVLRPKVSIAAAHLYLAATAFWAQGPPPTYKDTYNNTVYHYSVTLPHGVEAQGARPPNPNHGFTIDLAVADKAARVYRKTDSFIAVEGDYRPADGVQTLRQAIEFSRQASGGHESMQSESEASLGGLKAVRVISSFKAHGSLMFHEQIIALSDRFMYSVDLQTSAAHRAMAEKLFGEVVRGFRVGPGKL